MATWTTSLRTGGSLLLTGACARKSCQWGGSNGGAGIALNIFLSMVLAAAPCNDRNKDVDRHALWDDPCDGVRGVWI